MARQKPTAKPEFVLFDVLYEDGTLTSNRKVPGLALGGLEGDTPARAIIEVQDREIARSLSARAARAHRSSRSVGPPRARRRIRRASFERDNGSVVHPQPIVRFRIDDALSPV
jgi:hypothetical protein